MTDHPAIAPALGQALATRGYDSLTPVQAAMLDPQIEKQDLLVSAQTGSGKTVAFGIAAASSLLAGEDRLGHAGNPLALVVAPTRELAVQVHRELQWLYAEAGASVASCVGGMDPRDERRALSRGAHIVVGTPGRLVDHINRGGLVLDNIRVVVLDEADEMLNLGFREELETILKAAPESRRTLLFSATVSKSIARLAANFQRDAVRVNTISAGPLKSRAASAINKMEEKSFIEIAIEYCKRNAPLQKDLESDEVGKTALYLLSDLSSAVTGVTMYVDNGIHAMGMVADANVAAIAAE